MKTSDSFAKWADWYRNYLDRQLPVDWNSFERLPAHLKQVVGDSVRQFQLGESSEARNLKAKVARYVQQGGDPAYQEAMEWFIFEENRHARLLGRFMALEDIPKVQSHFSDKLFRLARHSVGLRLSITILLSAELIAVPYYMALRDVSRSPILTAICDQILLDEANHVRFQAKAIHTLLQGRGRLRLRIERVRASILLELALDVVWFNHGRLFDAAGWNFSKLRRAARVQFDWAWQMILSGQEIAVPAVVEAPPTPAVQPLRQPEPLWSDIHGI
jgi:hypothetical protein